MMRIGVDSGGTFTDFVFFDGKEITTLKLPSTPRNPALSILEGVAAAAAQKPVVVHGTTVATNAFLQKKIARTALLCTGGFEHILAIGRQDRVNLFSLQPQKPPLLVPLGLCFGIDERTLQDGTVARPLDRGDIEALAGRLKQKRVQSAAVVFLHAYKNPQNEQLAAEVLRRCGFYVTASHEILPEYREYERAVVTVLNAALKPVIADYIGNLEEGLKESSLYIMQSNGGVLSPQRIMEEPIRTMISGPAGGVIAGQQVARLKGYDNLITLDMGGTSTDVSVIKGGQLTITRQGLIEHLPLRIPTIDIATVGAGGGSIATVDRGGVLQVGPRSAGADPGPACYGKSKLATVTDAFVVTGVILPELFLGGRMKIYPQRSAAAVGRIAHRLGKSLHETAEGIILVSVSSMERALRAVTLEKGEDPRFYTLLPFGGAGGMVAGLLAHRLGIDRLLIPPYQGVFSALGMLEADFHKELSHSFLKMYTPEASTDMAAIFSQLAEQAAAILQEDGFDEKESTIHRLVELRYRGQSYELTVPYGPGFIDDFHRRHRQLYSYGLNDGDCEIVNLRVLAVGRTRKLKIGKQKLRAGDPPVYGRRRVYLNGAFRDFYLYLRKELAPGQRLRTPALVMADEATLVVDDGFCASVDEYANIIMERQP
jgi:N-methylhydantoinase A